MSQNRIYSVSSSYGQTFYFVVEPTDTGILVAIFDDKPSKPTERSNALAVAEFHVEAEDRSPVTRVLVRLWDDQVDKRGNAQPMLLIEADNSNLL